jgi:hypothetical protein
LAGKAGVRPSIEAPQDYIRANIVATQNILEMMKNKGIKKLAFASSSSVYGNEKEVLSGNQDVSTHFPLCLYKKGLRADQLYLSCPAGTGYCQYAFFHRIWTAPATRPSHSQVHQAHFKSCRNPRVRRW